MGTIVRGIKGKGCACNILKGMLFCRQGDRTGRISGNGEGGYKSEKKNIDKDSRFIPYKNLLGYYYYVEMYDYHNVRICSESADLRVQTKEKEENSNVVYEMVFHPNGNLNGSWVDNEDILLKYEEKNS